MQARFLRPAETEVDEAVAYFDEQRAGRGDRFEEDLRNTVEFVTAHPTTGKQITESVRQFRLSTFRYNIIYVIEAEEIVIVAVAHHRRRPGYWRSRLPERR